MERMIFLSDEERTEMGGKGRIVAMKKFDEKIIIQEYLDKLSEILK